MRSLSSILASSRCILAIGILTTATIGQQPNTPHASAIWGGVNGPPWPISVSTSAPGSITYVVAGLPNQPYALAYAPGGLVPGFSSTPFGSVDLDLALGVTIILDGFAGNTILDALANTGPNGMSSWTLPLPPALTGFLGGFQTLVGDPTSISGYRLAAATGLTVGPVARNPVPPDAIFVGSMQGGAPPFNYPGVTVVNTAATTGSNVVSPCTNVPATYGPPITGVLTPTPSSNRIANPTVLGVPGDIEIGSFLNPANTITDPPRGTSVPGVLNSQNGTATSGILNCLNPMLPPPNPPYGNFLYVTDTSAGALKVFNSYDFSLIATIPGVASPYGLGISPDLRYLYVSNNLQGTVQRIDANPVSPQFHTILNTIAVGNGPRAISVHPDNEDVIVCNFAENSISIISTSTQMERTRQAVGLGPSDAFVTRRMLCAGCTNEYMAFIPNFFSNTVSVYESFGGSVYENFPYGRIVWTEPGFLGPARGTWNWRSLVTLAPSGFGTNGPGCFVANTLGSSVDRLYLSNFTLSPPPGFLGPPGIRVFTHDAIATNYPNPSDVSIDDMSGLYNVNVAGTSNHKHFADIGLGGGVPSVLVVSYPSLGKCVAYDYNSPAFFSEVVIPGCDFLQSYYDQ